MSSHDVTWSGFMAPNGLRISRPYGYRFDRSGKHFQNSNDLERHGRGGRLHMRVGPQRRRALHSVAINGLKNNAATPATCSVGFRSTVGATNSQGSLRVANYRRSVKTRRSPNPRKIPPVAHRRGLR